MSEIRNEIDSVRILIWSDYKLDYYGEWEEQIDREFPELSEISKVEKAYQINERNLEKERQVLDIQMRTPIIAIKDLNRGMYKRTDFDTIYSGNIRDCFEKGKEYGNEWYLDKNLDLRRNVYDFNGLIEHILFRAFKEDITLRQMRCFQSDVATDRITNEKIDEYTISLGDEICKAHDWEIPEKEADEPER